MEPIIDILKIDSKFRTEKSAFRAIPNSTELNELFKQLVDMLGVSNRELARRLHVNKESVQAWCGKKGTGPHPIPIWVLDTLITQTGDSRELRIKVNSLFDKIRCGRTGTVQSFPKTLNVELCSLMGAHAADGSISQIPRRTSLDWQLTDQERESIELVSGWIKNNFGLELEVSKCKNANAWEIRTRVQILPKFLVEICDMPIGEKHDKVREPGILRRPNIDERLLTKPTESQKKEFEKAFASGVMIFDGYSTIIGETPSVGIGSNSQQLLSDLLRIFRENGISFGDFTQHRKILTTSFWESKKFFDLNFFQNISKQRKLKYLLLKRKSDYYPQS